MIKLKVLAVGSDAKTVKGLKLKVCTAILYLAPATEAGRGNLCPNASQGCRAACLFTAGRGRFANVRTARIKKTLRWFDDRRAFLADIVRDIQKLESYCRRKRLIPAVRLNGTSDIPWENVIMPDDGGNMMDLFPRVNFYDYTKSPARAIKAANGEMPANYSLTFSRSEDNQKHVVRVLLQGGNVAAVYSGKLHDEMRWNGKGTAKHKGKTIFNGDITDARFKDPKGVIVALRAKGEAKVDSTGFVIGRLCDE